MHNVDIITDLDYATLVSGFRPAERKGPDGEFRLAGKPSPDPLAILAVSDRKTSRYLLFDNDMRLVGWTNIDTGEVRSPWPELDVKQCRRLAFSGISMLSTAILPLMQSWPERFPVIDFYLDICRDHEIRGIDITGAGIRDVGKLKELEVRA